MFDRCVDRSALSVAALVHVERRRAATLSRQCFQALAFEELPFCRMRGTNV
jgi:hypothetical protein